MAKVTWILADGRAIVAEVADGTNMMNAAAMANVPGIIGECGGCLSCATCHVYVDEAWAERTGEPDGTEDAMLDATDAPRRETSRLSCQIVASGSLDGLVLHVPA
ncbi:2Fe-2S iron-sulfur cluster-binding protein [Gellertiella hungarica]|uniref:2Fe-2S ferredoxin n=1 Tax=Gellertiella hungarica TaxID=1572859 RepID=A0A7W6NIQ0_9HYPH|nr:2Fe-2S iron-sulfur cluster-binding protein [Gellertiella hungarica]MBB4062963.1 2Fe-2S ferredoxin [Gellertiella hungarica]